MEHLEKRHPNNDLESNIERYNQRIDKTLDTFSCDQCDVSCNSNLELNQHYMYRHLERLTNIPKQYQHIEKPYEFLNLTSKNEVQCNICKETVIRTTFQKHLTNIHPDFCIEKGYPSCELCPVKIYFMNEYDLMQHKNVKHLQNLGKIQDISRYEEILYPTRNDFKGGIMKKDEYVRMDGTSFNLCKCNFCDVILNNSDIYNHFIENHSYFQKMTRITRKTFWTLCFKCHPFRLEQVHTVLNQKSKTVVEVNTKTTKQACVCNMCNSVLTFETIFKHLKDKHENYDSEEEGLLFQCLHCDGKETVSKSWKNIVRPGTVETE